MEKSEKEDTIHEMKNSTCNPQRRTRRRLIQSTLFRCESRENEEDRDFPPEEHDDEEESEDSDCKSKKRKRKAQTKTPKKSPAKNKRALDAKNKTSPVAARSDFFLKVSERRLQQKQQKDQEGVVDLTAEDGSKALESVAKGKKSRQSLKKGGVKSTPCKSRSCGDAKGSHFQPTETSCKSNVANDLNTQNENMPQPVADLWLEAKRAAEENARLSSGKQTHPFFSSWKATKKFLDNIEISEVGSKGCVLQVNGIFSCSAIHVIDTPQDDLISLDWGNWMFCERSLLTSCDHYGCGYSGPETPSNSVFEDSVAPLKIDSFFSTPNCYQTSSLENELSQGQQPDVGKTAVPLSTTASTRLADGQEALERLLTYLKMIQQNDKIGLFSGCTGCVDKSEDALQLKFLQESMLSHHLRHRNQSSCSLWTNKYQPEVATEVCGNVDSVRSLNDWMQCWRERVPQTSKSSVNGGKCDFQDSDSWCQNDSDTENMDEGGILKNVFLITGPVGSGKSAAIYACAKEQGFHVIEVNASDWRNGVNVKQKFGEAVESHGFNRWSAEEQTGSRRKHSAGLCSAKENGIVSQESDCEVIEVTSTVCKQELWNAMTPSQNATENRTSSSQGETKTLILFEDVDIIFDEDRGFTATLSQLAETAKRPMILTSNSKDPVLPHLLDRLVVDFSVPPLEELLSEAYMVCTAEKTNISLQLIERFIRCCQGDIRKTLMLLQFWCQGKRSQRDRNIECTYSPLQFDPVAGHHVLPKLIPWGFSCQLSVLVEKEISNTLSLVKENSMFMEAVEEHYSMGSRDALELGNNGTGSIEARKEAMLRRNCSARDGNDFVTQFLDNVDFSNDPDSPITFAHQAVRQKLATIFSSDSEEGNCCLDNLAGQTARRKLNMILSSDSEDGKCCADNVSVHAVRRKLNTVLSPDSEDEKYCSDSLPAMLHITPQDPNNKILPDLSIKSLDQSIIAPSCLEQSLYDGPYKISETASDSHICDMYKSVNVSCVPESSFVPETEINGGGECLSKSTSCNHFDFTLEDVTMGGVQGLPMMEVNASDGTAAEANKHSDTILGYACEVVAESVNGNEEVGECQNVNAEVVTKGYAVMDECSRADFSAGLTSMENARNPLAIYLMQESLQKIGCPLVSDLVQETWRELRGRQEDLKSHVTSEERDASKIVEFASGLTDLISKADVMLSSCQPLTNDILEPSMVPCVGPDSFSWYDEQLEMTSTFAQHGFGLFSERIAAIGMKLGHENKVDLAQEMLVCSTSTMAQGKLATQEMSRGPNSCHLEISAPDIDISFSSREVEPRLYGTVSLLVPTRSRLALKGPALHEYSSFLSQISRSESSRLQENNSRTKQRGRYVDTEIMLAKLLVVMNLLR
eukprot:TRINITY_DN6691_c0_g1_i9.p1 TRINITY_DN6691_c0_g1~~TRINITY_DN6691_c0_g1_i9.p1  ORF type:complete len:1428 (+),score=321.23 TRINITY_DN6691_c0_g1_i9:161-4285(+)